MARQAAGRGAPRQLLLMPPYYFRYQPEDIEEFLPAVSGRALRFSHPPDPL